MIRDCIARALVLGTASVLIALLTIVGLGFLVSAAYLLLAARVPAPEAAALTGVSLLAAGALAGLIVRSVAAKGPKRMTAGPSAHPSGSAAAGIPTDFTELGAAARRFTAQSPGTAAAAAFTIGAILGTSPVIRGIVEDILRQNHPSP